MPSFTVSGAPVADRSRRPRLVASFPSIDTGTRKALGFAIRESDRRHYVEIAGLDRRDEDRVPTGRAITCPLTELRPMRHRLAEMDRRAVELGLLPEERA